MVTKRTPAKPKRDGRKPKTLGELDPTLFSDIIALGKAIPKSELARYPKDASGCVEEELQELLP